ncbi:techylectin-5A, partial [Nephila pilipes]
MISLSSNHEKEPSKDKRCVGKASSEKKFYNPEMSVEVLAANASEIHEKISSFTMIKALLFLCFTSLTISIALENTTTDCNFGDKSVLYLDVASDMIAKAKEHFPTCSTTSSKPTDCEEVLRWYRKKSGVYTIWPKSRVTENKPIDVFCDMDTDGGGWT